MCLLQSGFDEHFGEVGQLLCVVDDGGSPKPVVVVGRWFGTGVWVAVVLGLFADSFPDAVSEFGVGVVGGSVVSADGSVEDWDPCGVVSFAASSFAFKQLHEGPQVGAGEECFDDFVGGGAVLSCGH